MVSLRLTSATALTGTEPHATSAPLGVEHGNKPQKVLGEHVRVVIGSDAGRCSCNRI